MKKTFFTNRIHLYLLSAITLLIAFYAIQYGARVYNSDNALASRFQQNFIQQQLILEDKSVKSLEIINDTLTSNWPVLERLLDPHNIFTQIFEKDSLIFWNTNHIQIQLDKKYSISDDTVIKEKTGWYLVHFKEERDFRIFLLKRIKSDYPVENKFLPSNTDKDFVSTNNIQLIHDLSKAQHVINSINGTPIIGLNIDDYNGPGRNLIICLFFIFVLAYLMVVLWISLLYQRMEQVISGRGLLFVFYIIDLLLLRLADIYFTFPAVLKQSFLFEPTFEIFRGLNSIGDLLITAMLFLVVLFRFSRHMSGDKPSKSSRNKFSWYMVSMFGAWVFTTGSFYVIYQLIGKLRINPALGVQIGGYENLISIVIIILLNVLLYLILRFINYQSLKLKLSFIYEVLFLSILAIITSFYIVDNSLIVIVSFSFLLLLISILKLIKNAPNLKFQKYMLHLIIFATANALIINESIHKTKDKNQELTANYLTQKNDKHLEQKFLEFTNKTTSDTVIKLIIDNYQDDPELALNDYLQTNYFKEISGKYDIQLTLCTPEKLLEIQPEALLIGCDEYFKGLISDYGDSTGVNNLYLQNSTPESIYYIGVISNDVLQQINPEIKLYIEFYFTYVPEGLGYPELLVDNKTLSYDLSGYSFAKYSNDKLVYKFGDFAYYTDYSSIRKFPSSNFYNYNGFRHLKIVTKGGDTLVISRPTVRISEQMATFSILFLILSLTTILIFISFYYKEVKSYFAISFRTRLQVFFIGIISVTILIIAIITTYYAENSNKDRLITQLNEKTYSVLIELQHKLGSINSFDEFPTDELEPLLRKFSLVFFSDINVYDPSGKLVASSRPEIFNKGLLSELINPLAFEEINVDNKLFYTVEEKIGELAYYSSYVPLNLGNNDPVGIVNLPYFARQTEVKKSYFLMIFSFLNLFVIAGILGTFIALFISKVLTRPLVVLQQNLSEIRIDEKNERIDWDADDEIGMLIREYNQMVDKLEQSAELLKHSERESAWREVARQIAHEIKNPLTPMKLNVQYLERAYSEDDPASKDKVRSISKSLIQQIDTLDKVAEMFSDFAISNVRKFDKVDIVKVINSAAALFKNYKNIIINIDHEEKTCYIKAAEKDMVRVFNNLIKNAAQSLENKQTGIINISVLKTVSNIEVRITDNGKGIDDEFKSRVFQPYFTTKSGGTGLGLAIVKNIMNEIGGSISFESTENGTTFFLKFKIHDESK